MLLQTLVQLNILILATPALAGWSVLPPVHAGAARASCIVWQYRPVETAAPRSPAAAQARQVKRAVVFLRPPFAPLAVVPAAAPRAILVSLPAFPHAARAP